MPILDMILSSPVAATAVRLVRPVRPVRRFPLHHPADRPQCQPGIHQLRTVSDQRREMMDVPRVSRLGDQADPEAKPMIHQVATHRSDGKQHGNRYPLRIRLAIADDHEANSGSRSLLCLRAQPVERVSQALGTLTAVPSRVERQTVGQAVLDVENGGGAVWQAVLPLLNQFARVPVSGIIAYYEGGYSSGDDFLPETMRQVIAKRLTLRGFINYDFAAEYFVDFVRDVSEWLKEGRIHYREHIVDELENAPKAFIGMLNGENLGKALVRLP